MKRMSAVVISLAMAACGGGGGGVGISAAKAVTPSTPEVAAQNLSTTLTVVNGEFGEIATGFVGGKTKLGKTTNGIVEKLRAQQGIAGAFCDNPSSVSETKIVCPCDKGNLTISGDFSKLQGLDGSGDGTIDFTLTLDANKCVEEEGDRVDTSNGAVKMSISGSIGGESGEVDMNIEVDVKAVFTTVKAGVLEDEVAADLLLAIDMSIDSAAMQAAIDEAGDDAEAIAEIDPENYFKILQSMDGSIAFFNFEDTCFNGVYVFKTIEKLQSGGCAGYKAGKLDVNGVTYAFAESEVTMSGGVSGTFTCEELPQGDSCEE